MTNLRKHAERVAAALASPAATIVGALLGAVAIAVILEGDHRGVDASWAFGRVEHRSLPNWHAIAVVAVVAPWLIRHVLRRSSPAVFLIVSFAVGVALHGALLLSEKESLRALEQRVWVVGHAEFVRIASRPLPDDFVRGYEARVRSERWVFPRSKPPGALFVYRALARASETWVGKAAARIVYAADDHAHELPTSRTTATVVLLLTLATFATIFPLYALSRRLWDGSTARVAVALWTTCPLVALVSLHLDNGLYPLLAATVLMSMALAGPGLRGCVAAFAAGLVMSAALFVTFSMLPIVPLAAAVPFARPGGWKLRLRNTAVYGAAILLCWIAVEARTGLDLRARFTDAQSFHAHWWSGGGHNWTVGNTIQFAVWLGVPFCLSFVQQGWPLRLSTRLALAGPWVWCCAVDAVLIALIFSGTAKSEVMRLWAFLVPALATVAAPRAKVLDERWRGWFVPAVVVLQIGSAFVLHAQRSP